MRKPRCTLVVLKFYKQLAASKESTQWNYSTVRMFQKRLYGQEIKVVLGGLSDIATSPHKYDLSGIYS